jgi:nitrite reductase (NADH) small subunit/3-phenylpropionate/trans-cinnamate dioxygenase ferredoxin subunit
MTQRVTIAKVGEIPSGSSVVVSIGNKDIAVFNHNGCYYAIDDSCPHQGASLAGGHIEDGCVICPRHAWRFRLSDGAWADNPRLKTGWYPVHVVGEQIQLEIPEALLKGNSAAESAC